MPNRRRLTRLAASVGQSVGLPVASVVVSLLAVRTSGVETWGVFVGWMIVVQLAAQVADFGSRDALVRAFSRAPGHWEETWRTAIASRMALLAAGPVLFALTSADLPSVALMLAWLAALFLSRAHDSAVVYRRAYGWALAVELSVIGITIAGVLLAGAAATPFVLLFVFAAAAVVRAIAYVARFPLARIGPGWAIRLDELRRSLPFFLLTFSGALQSRVDLYVVALVLQPSALGGYQVLTSFVLLVQSLAGALLNPTVPALYRASREAVVAGTVRLLAVGLVLATGAAVTLWLLVGQLYDLALPPDLVVVSWLAMVPAFGYLPLVYLAFREGDERVVVLANVVGIMFSGALAFLLAPVVGLTGAMASAAAGQAAILGLHVMRTRWRRDQGSAPAAGTWAMATVEAPDALPDM
jgi:O-antigen/teichoic acid export membrane protein